MLKDMAGQKPEIEHLRAGEHGLEMSSKDGHLLLFGCTNFRCLRCLDNDPAVPDSSKSVMIET